MEETHTRHAEVQAAAAEATQRIEDAGARLLHPLHLARLPEVAVTLAAARRLAEEGSQQSDTDLVSGLAAVMGEWIDTGETKVAERTDVHVLHLLTEDPQ
jgi:hypothetical protein